MTPQEYTVMKRREKARKRQKRFRERHPELRNSKPKKQNGEKNEAAEIDPLLLLFAFVLENSSGTLLAQNR